MYISASSLHTISQKQYRPPHCLSRPRFHGNSDGPHLALSSCFLIMRQSSINIFWDLGLLIYTFIVSILFWSDLTSGNVTTHHASVSPYVHDWLNFFFFLTQISPQSTRTSCKQIKTSQLCDTGLPKNSFPGDRSRRNQNEILWNMRRRLTCGAKLPPLPPPHQLGNWRSVYRDTEASSTEGLQVWQEVCACLCTGRKKSWCVPGNSPRKPSSSLSLGRKWSAKWEKL